MYIRSIATFVPDNFYSQEEIGDVMLRGKDPASREARLLNRIYRHSDIRKRHSVIRDHAENTAGLFLDDDLSTLRSPTTKERNDRYIEESRPMYRKVASDALDVSGLSASDITHVITASCTGFSAPGPDFFLVQDLGLRSTCKRLHLGFMGCYAAFPALRTADSIIRSDPNACVLVACLELCTLHLQPSDEIDKIIATSVFGDGASAAVVSASPGGEPGSSLKMGRFATSVAGDSQKDMAWSIGDNGFDMILSTYVPRILEADVPGIVDSLLKENELTRSDVHHWAIHPGGKAILDGINRALGLGENQLDAPRKVLSEYGNMSSATILFVLNEIVATAASPDHTIFAMAFGPGLTVESALFTVV